MYQAIGVKWLLELNGEKVLIQQAIQNNFSVGVLLISRTKTNRKTWTLHIFFPNYTFCGIGSLEQRRWGICPRYPSQLLARSRPRSLYNCTKTDEQKQCRVESWFQTLTLAGGFFFNLQITPIYKRNQSETALVGNEWGSWLPPSQYLPPSQGVSLTKWNWYQTVTEPLRDRQNPGWKPLFFFFFLVVVGRLIFGEIQSLNGAAV